MVTADPIVKVVGTIGLVVEVVRLGQPGQKPTAIAAERDSRKTFVHSRSELGRCVPRHSAKDRLTVAAKVCAEQCQKFKNNLDCDLAGTLRALAAAAAAVADFREEFAVALHEPALLLDFLRCAGGMLDGGGLLLLGQATIPRRTRLNEPLAKQDAERMAGDSLGNHMLFPASQRCQTAPSSVARTRHVGMTG